MVRPLTRTQQLENAAFLRALRRTGNVRDAARAVGAHRAKFTKRRVKHPAFATAWDAALALADAALLAASTDARSAAGPAVGSAAAGAAAPRIHRTRSGRLQLRRAQPGRLDQAACQRFLAALGATANVRLAAQAAGFSHAAFYAHKRADPGFAREWRLALQCGYDRLEEALLAGWAVESHADDQWRHNEPLAIPPMTPEQALQLMNLHQKEARLWTTPVPDRLRPGETWQARSVMLGMIYKAKQERDCVDFLVAEAARRDRGRPTIADYLTPGTELPDPGLDLGLDLAQVTGWSHAAPAPPPADAPQAHSADPASSATTRPAGGVPCSAASGSLPSDRRADRDRLGTGTDSGGHASPKKSALAVARCGYAGACRGAILAHTEQTYPRTVRSLGFTNRSYPP